MSRTATKEDQMNFMMITSDPVISSLRKPVRNKRKPIPPEVLAMLIPGSIPPVYDNDEDEVDMEDLEAAQCEYQTQLEDDNEDDQRIEELFGESTLADSNLEDENEDVTLPDYYHATHDVEFGHLST